MAISEPLLSLWKEQAPQVRVVAERSPAGPLTPPAAGPNTHLRVIALDGGCSFCEWSFAYCIELQPAPGPQRSQPQTSKPSAHYHVEDSSCRSALPRERFRSAANSGPCRPGRGQ
jgi:hypothetical protein